MTQGMGGARTAEDEDLASFLVLMDRPSATNLGDHPGIG